MFSLKGERYSHPWGVYGSTENVVDAEVAELAVIRTDVGVDTADVETVKLPVVAPNGIVKLTGTVTDGLLLERFTTTPPSMAGRANVTVPVALCPPVTDAGVTLTPDTAPVPEPDGLITNVAFTEFADVAVIVASTDSVTEEVETVNVPLD